VNDLKRDDFRVYDNDVGRPIESLWRDEDLQLTVGMIIDASECQIDQLTEHRQTALEVLDRLLRSAHYNKWVCPASLPSRLVVRVHFGMRSSTQRGLSCANALDRKRC
jgi:hypothetical protein